MSAPVITCPGCGRHSLIVGGAEVPGPYEALCLRCYTTLMPIDLPTFSKLVTEQALANWMKWLAEPIGPAPMTARQLANEYILERLRRR